MNFEMSKRIMFQTNGLMLQIQAMSCFLCGGWGGGGGGGGAKTFTDICFVSFFLFVP